MKKKIVVKFGTSSLTNGTPRLFRPQMIEFTRQICHLHSEGHQLVVVSSGAIAAGREHFPCAQSEQSLPSKQMLASIGQLRLIHTWSEMFSIFGVTIGQILLTKGDISDEKRALNIQNTFLTLLEHRIIPIVNENDTVSTDEIRFGDNDNLSALLATFIEADLLILLTDQEGLYTKDPRFHPDAELIERICAIDESIAGYAQGTPKDGVGTGGMATKVQAAKKATEHGIETVIASSKLPNVLIDASLGKPVGTLFTVRDR